MRHSHENDFVIPFRLILPLSRETDLCLILMANTKYIVCQSFQTLNRNLIEYPRFTNCYGKHSKKRMLWQSETKLHGDMVTVYIYVLVQDTYIYI